MLFFDYELWSNWYERGERSAKSVNSTCIVGELSTVEWLHSGRYFGEDFRQSFEE